MRRWEAVVDALSKIVGFMIVAAIAVLPRLSAEPDQGVVAQTTFSTDVVVIDDKAIIQRFHSSIVGADYDCPSVKLAFKEAKTEAGTLFMVYCGIRSVGGALPAIMYRVIDLNGQPLLVVPW